MGAHCFLKHFGAAALVDAPSLLDDFKLYIDALPLVPVLKSRPKCASARCSNDRGTPSYSPCRCHCGIGYGWHTFHGCGRCTLGGYRRCRTSWW
jgi:hypothetical protein